MALAHFGTGQGGFYDTADDAEQLVARPADPTDNATPSGAVVDRGGAGHLRGADRRDLATGRRPSAALATVAPLIAGHARFAGYACAVGEALLSRPVRDRRRHGGAASRSAGPGRAGGTRRRARSWSRASRTAAACRCWRDRPLRDGAANARTSAAASSATRPVTTEEQLAAALA